MPPRKKLNVAMIGYGFMGRAHSNAFHQAGRFFDLPYEPCLKVVCGRNASAVENMAAQWGWEEVATDWRSVVARKDIDVVDVCTPNYLHSAIAEAAAQADKIVLCEKPLAMTLEEAQRMAEVASKVPTMVWFNYRRVPAITLARRLMDEGRLGRIYQYRATYLQSWGENPADLSAWRFNKSQAGSGAMGDLLSHSIDLALWLNGPLAELSACTKTFAQNREVDDAVFMLAGFENGSVGTFEATRYAIGCQNRNYFEIHGSKGAVRFNLEDMNRLEFFDATDAVEVQGSHRLLVTGPQHPYTDCFWPPGHIIGYEHTFISSFADFLKSLANDVRFHPNFDDAVEVQQVLEAVDLSSGNRKWVRVQDLSAARQNKSAQAALSI